MTVDSYNDFNFNTFNENELDKLKNFNVVCITDFIPKDNLVKINNYCRQNKIGFILALSYGIGMTIFVDFGDNHISLDVDGEDITSYSISKIDQLDNGDMCIEC